MVNHGLLCLLMTRFQNHVLRQLHDARAPRDSRSTPSLTEVAIEHNLSKIPKRDQPTHGQEIFHAQAGQISGPPTSKRMKWSKISSSGTAGTTTSKYTFNFLDNMIVMKEGPANTRRFLLHNEPIFSRSSPYTLQFSVLDADRMKLKWRSHDLILVDSHNPQMEECMGVRKVAKIPKSLLVLDGSRKLCRYDLNNGRKMEELDLTYPGGPHYSSVVVDDTVREKGIFVIANPGAVKKTHTGMLLELVILSTFPKLRVCHRLLVRFVFQLLYVFLT